MDYLHQKTDNLIPPHPIQPTFKNNLGELCFYPNSIVKKIVDEGLIKLKTLSSDGYDSAEISHIWQLAGESVSRVMSAKGLSIDDRTRLLDAVKARREGNQISEPHLTLLAVQKQLVEKLHAIDVLAQHSTLDKNMTSLLRSTNRGEVKGINKALSIIDSSIKYNMYCLHPIQPIYIDEYNFQARFRGNKIIIDLINSGKINIYEIKKSNQPADEIMHFVQLSGCFIWEYSVIPCVSIDSMKRVEVIVAQLDTRINLRLSMKALEPP